MPDKGDRSLWTSRASLALGGGMIGLGCVLLVRRYRRYRRKRQSIPENDSKAPDLVERFCAKRQHLLWLLSQDPAILLKNQLAARHLMTTDVTTVSPGTTRERTQELMREAHVRHLPVCGPGQKLLGIVSDGDLRGRPGKTAGELMTTQLKTVAPDMLISAATTHLIHAGISSLPVIEDGRLCGILTTTDLALALQCLLQLWLYTTAAVPSEVWGEKLLKTVQSQRNAAEAEHAAAIGATSSTRGRMPGSGEGPGMAPTSNASAEKALDLQEKLAEMLAVDPLRAAPTGARQGSRPRMGAANRCLGTRTWGGGERVSLQGPPSLRGRRCLVNSCPWRHARWRRPG